MIDENTLIVSIEQPKGDVNHSNVDSDATLTELGGEEREKKEKALVCKVDIRMMPLMMLLYVLNYLDRNNIATARLSTFEKDLDLQGTQYNTIISIFFVGYFLTQIPMNLVLDKVRPSLFLPAVMCMWAIASACTGAVQSYSGMVVLRFILGFVETPFFPGALYLFSSWYTKRELAKRIFILYGAGQMAGAFGGLLGAAILRGMDGKGGLPAWRWLFICEGVVCFSVAALTMKYFPDYPKTTKWLTVEERNLAVLRISEEACQEDNRSEVTSMQGAKLAFQDPVLYLFCFMALGLNTAGSFVYFFPTIVQTLGYGQTTTLFLSAPPYVFAAILGICNSWHSDKTGERWLHIVWPQVLCSIGFVISATTTNLAARYTATFLMMSVSVSFGCILAWVSTSMARPPSKRAAAYAIINAGSNLASIYASYFYPKSQGPGYWQANTANVAFACLCIILATATRFYLVWRNQQLDKAVAQDLADGFIGRMNESKAAEVAARWQCDPSYRFTK